MEASMVPRGSVVLSEQDAQAVFAVHNRYNGTINWMLVASELGTSEEVARQRYSRVLSSLPALTAASDSLNTTESIPASDDTAASASSNASADPTINDPPAASVSPSVAEINTASEPTTTSTTSNAAITTVTRQPTKLSDLRPRVLPRLSGNHRTCCFHGYRWCCSAQGCNFYTLCACDLRNHFKKAHTRQAASFDYALLVHRGDQEAKAWAEGDDMDEDE